jgi:hypothetical protein
VRRMLAVTVLALLVTAPVQADDAVKECKDFFEKFDKCVDKLEGEEKDDAKIFVRTLKGTLGMADDLNQEDSMMLGILCSATMEEAKKDPDVQKYNCEW